MILFLNTFITDQKLIGYVGYNRGLLGSFSRADVFKYSLASLSVIDWSNVIIYYDLDTNYKHMRGEIDQYIRSLFRNPIIFPFRIERQPQWKVAMNELFSLADDFVWFCCNHDHIFIDYELDLLKRIETKLIDLSKSYEYVSCYFSHWPEILYYGKTPPRFTRIGAVEENRDCFVTVWSNYDSVQIANKKLLRYWWFDHEYGDIWMPRTDSIAYNVISPETACVIPYRELVRHFDGYSHNNIDINICPPLFIPEGFFDNQIKILYCSDTRKKGYVHVNPLKDNYSTIDNEGADLKCMLEDLPLFWRPRISQIEVTKVVDRELLTIHRNDAILKIASQMIQLPTNKLDIALR